MLDRREWMWTAGAGVAAGMVGGAWGRASAAEEEAPEPLVITGMEVVPIALPDPPLLAAGGCHGPYFLRNVVKLETDAGITGWGEIHGNLDITEGLKKAREVVIGQNAFAYRRFAGPLEKLNRRAYPPVEMACLDACGKATGRRLCELLGGPVRERVEFAAYLFFRYAADHPKVLADARVMDGRGRGGKALDEWGEVRTPQAMARMAEEFRRKWGFRAMKLKAGVFEPEMELETLRLMNERFDGACPLRIDPNGRWKVETAVRIGEAMKGLPLEYYEDPVRGQEAMSEVRRRTGHVMSTNSCVTGFDHIPRALELEPIDVVLADHHVWGGIPACQALGRMCRTAGWGMSQHSNNHSGLTMAAMIHVGAVCPEMNYASDTHYVWLPEGADIIAGGKLPIRDGFMQVPRGPGLGVDVNEDALARAHETYVKCGMRRRNDAETMRTMVPGWERSLF